jgi:hypothetical protein
MLQHDIKKPLAYNTAEDSKSYTYAHHLRKQVNTMQMRVKEAAVFLCQVICLTGQELKELR